MNKKPIQNEIHRRRKRKAATNSICFSFVDFIECFISINQKKKRTENFLLFFHIYLIKLTCGW